MPMLKEVAIMARDSERLQMIQARNASRIGQLIKLVENLQAADLDTEQREAHDMLPEETSVSERLAASYAMDLLSTFTV